MFKFIKLIESCNGGTTNKDVLLNLSFIKCIQQGDKTKDTHIAMSDGKYYFVRESLEAIQLLINIDTSRSPVIMTATEALEYYKLRDGV